MQVIEIAPADYLLPAFVAHSAVHVDRIALLAYGREIAREERLGIGQAVLFPQPVLGKHVEVTVVYLVPEAAEYLIPPFVEE